MSTRTPPRLITLVFLAGLGVIGLNMFLPALPGIAADLDASLGLTSVAVAGYLAATAVMQLVAGPLSDRIGRRPIVLGALAIFVATSVVCALAQTIWVFLTARLLQSAVVTGFAMALAITRDTLPPKEAAGRLATIAMFMGIAPLLGPMIGGFIDELAGWRAIFWTYAGAGIFMISWAWVDLGETRPDTAPETKGKVIDLLTAPLFWAFAICTAFSVGGFFVFIASVPVVGAQTFGLTSAQIGMGVGSITAGYIVGSAITSRIAGRVPIPVMMLAGRLFACAGMIGGLIAFALLPPWPLLLFGAIIFAGFGNGLTLPPSNAGVLSVRPGMAGTAAGASGAFTVAIGAVLTGVAGPLIAANPTPQLLLTFILIVVLIGLAAAWATWRLMPDSDA